MKKFLVLLCFICVSCCKSADNNHNQFNGSLHDTVQIIGTPYYGVITNGNSGDDIYWVTFVDSRGVVQQKVFGINDLTVIHHGK